MSMPLYPVTSASFNFSKGAGVSTLVRPATPHNTTTYLMNLLNSPDEALLQDG